MKISKLCISILILLFFSCNTNNVRSLNQPLVIKVDTILIESTKRYPGEWSNSNN